MADQIINKVEDLSAEHEFHTLYESKCPTCWAENLTIKSNEVKCEGCKIGLGRTERYGRNICEMCQERLLG